MINDLCFEIIQKCLNECKFCSSNSSENSENYIKYDDFKKTVLYLHNKYGIREISLSGGEPFLHPDLLEMVMLCKNLGIKTTIYTSGIIYKKTMSDQMYETNLRLLREKYENKDLNMIKTYENEVKILENERNEKFTSLDSNLLKYLEWCGLDKIVFDFQAMNYDVLTNIMGQSELIYHLSASISKVNKMNIMLDNHFIPTKINYKEIKDIIEILNIYENSTISILRFIPQGRGFINKDELLLSNSEFEEFKLMLNESIKQYPGVKVRLGIPMNTNDEHLCTAGLSKLTIRYDGYVLPCPAFKELSVDELEKINFKVITIYDNLEDFKISNETREKPLCKKLYRYLNKK